MTGTYRGPGKARLIGTKRRAPLAFAHLSLGFSLPIDCQVAMGCVLLYLLCLAWLGSHLDWTGLAFVWNWCEAVVVSKGFVVRLISE